MIVPRTRTVHYGPRSFRVMAPQIRNTKPSYLKDRNISRLNSSGRALRLLAVCASLFNIHRRRRREFCLNSTLEMTDLTD